MKKQRTLWIQLKDFLSLAVKQRRGLLPVMALGAAAAAAAGVVNLICYARIIDLVLAGDYRSALTWVAVMLGATLALTLIANGCTRRLDTVSQGCRYGLKQQMLAKNMSIPYEDLESAGMLEQQRHLQNQEGTFGTPNYHIRKLYAMLQQLLGIGTSLAFVAVLLFQAAPGGGFWGGPWPVALAAVLAAGIIWLSAAVDRRCSEVNERSMEENVHANAVAQYLNSVILNLKNAKDIRIYRTDRLLLRLVQASNDQSNGVFDRAYCLCSHSNTFGIAMTQIVSVMAYAVIGAKALGGAIGIGQVTMYAGAVVSLVRGIRGFCEELSDFRRRSDYLDQYASYLKSKGSHYDGTLPVEKRDDARFQFTFEDVCFAYPGTDQLVLDHVSFQFTVGEHFALVGRNGAGKTTLIKLLCRLYAPTSGRILLNGIDIQYYDFDEYATLFSVVFQDFGLISGPLGENVAGGEQVDEARAWNCLERAGVKRRFERDGLNVRLYKDTGEDGVEVSGGEAQKIAIARALYKDAPFVILDEPTAALDPYSEAEIYEKFNDLIQEKTAIYISHRMSSCKFCDQILVMDQGKIAEQGDHEALMAQNGIYAALYEAQAQYYAQA